MKIVSNDAAFSSVVKEADKFRKVIESLKELCDECNIECAPDGIKTQCMDTSHVALVSMLLKPEGFLHYVSRRTLSLGLNLANFSKVLRCGGPKDKLSIRATSEERIEVAFDNENENRTSTFDLKLIDLDADNLGIPEHEYTCKITMPSNEFARVCRDLSSMGDTLNVFCSKMGIQFSVKGDKGSGSMVYRKEASSKGPNGITIEMEKNVKQQYAMSYLIRFSKSSVLSSKVNLSLSEGIPLRVCYEVENLGTMQYFLAPKYET